MHLKESIGTLVSSKAIIKGNSIFFFFLQYIYAFYPMNLLVKEKKYCLLLGNITLVFKKGARTSKNNYRPVSILPIFPKLIEKLLQKSTFSILSQCRMKVSGRFSKRVWHGKLLIIDA